MNRCVLIVAALALTLPAAALAKGASSATVSGPGLNGTVAIPGAGEGDDGTPLGALASYGGYFAQVFGQAPDPTAKARPKGDLGPGYTVRYTVPGPGGKSFVSQVVYPYAKPSPVTYMPPNQPFRGGQKTYGGWLVADARVKDALVKAGLPTSAPSGGGIDWTSWISAATSITIALGLATVALFRRRSRPSGGSRSAVEPA
jgi:hypothetical protein